MLIAYQPCCTLPENQGSNFFPALVPVVAVLVNRSSRLPLVLLLKVCVFDSCRSKAVVAAECPFARVCFFLFVQLCILFVPVCPAVNPISSCLSSCVSCQFLLVSVVNPDVPVLIVPVCVDAPT